MTFEQMESAIEFLLEHHSRFSVDIDQIKEIQRQQAEAALLQGKRIDRLYDTVAVMAQSVERLADEIREGFDNLIVANEVTRDLAQRVGELAVATSRRVTKLEET